MGSKLKKTEGFSLERRKLKLRRTEISSLGKQRDKAHKED